MNKAIIGKKLGMTQVFLADGTMVPVTVIQAGPCTVTQKKTVERDGYEALQFGFETVAERKLTKPQLGHLKNSGVVVKHLHEFKLDGSNLEVGQTVTCDVFAEGDVVDVTGIT
ncbi:MAG: 50S ribosomal protein L3, partial [Clostridia bacterium]|nr:50S ribosomal protein L3 [Clostridia bacterium]